MTHLINEAVYRTAPATPGLLKSILEKESYKKKYTYSHI